MRQKTVSAHPNRRLKLQNLTALFCQQFIRAIITRLTISYNDVQRRTISFRNLLHTLRRTLAATGQTGLYSGVALAANTCVI